MSWAGWRPILLHSLLKKRQWTRAPAVKRSIAFPFDRRVRLTDLIERKHLDLRDARHERRLLLVVDDDLKVTDHRHLGLPLALRLSTG
jgi:hypothetical protein